MMMDHGACNVIYLDRRAHPERVRRDNVLAGMNARDARASLSSPGYFTFGRLQNTAEVLSNAETLLSIFNEVDICRTGASCLQRLLDLHNASAIDDKPVIVLIDLPYDEEQRMKRLSREPRTPSPTTTRTTGPDLTEPGDLYGMHFLRHVAAEIQDRRIPKLVIPIIVLSGLDKERAPTDSPSLSRSQALTDTVRLVRYLDAGAVDVLASPLSKDHIHGLAVHAHRITREVKKEKSSFLAQKARKVSWVGVNEAKPFSYLREAMVSNLMGNICCPDTSVDTLDPNDIEVSPDRRAEIARAVGTWSFSAHDFTDDELLFGSLTMLQHALSMPEVERWRMDEDELMIFLLATRSAYNEFVLYHNFRHVVDVLQALFFFLVQIGALPAYPPDVPQSPGRAKPAIATLLKPFDALTLLISAIGHDVGHPGVNNAFLVSLNAPLAQLYNDRSVLESFHCAAYSQILRRYWPTAFQDASMRKLMINSILATDMGLHFKYMADLGNLQEKLGANNGGIDGWSPKVLEDYRDLLCGLLIKCADISNVVRKFNTAVQWATILTDEFSNQGQMENELQMPTCLFGGPPDREDLVKLGESQIGFMNIFARPLFESVSDILPSMRFSVDELIANKHVWQSTIEEEKERNTVRLNIPLGVSTMDHARSPLSTSRVDLSEKPEKRSSESKRSEKRSSEAKRSWEAKRSSELRPAAPPRMQSRTKATPPPLPLPTTFPPPERSSGRSTPLSAMFGRRSSAANAIPSPRLVENNASHARRGSADASLTTILVTHDPSSHQPKAKKKGLHLRSQSPGKRKGSKLRSDSPVRPLSPEPETSTATPTDFVIQPRVPNQRPVANGALQPNNHLLPHSSSQSPLSGDPDRNNAIPPKPRTADGSSPPDFTGVGVAADTHSFPRWRRERGNSSAGNGFRSRRKGSLTPALPTPTGETIPLSATEADGAKNGPLLTEGSTVPSPIEPTEAHIKQKKGFGFGRFFRRKKEQKPLPEEQGGNQAPSEKSDPPMGRRGSLPFQFQRRGSVPMPPKTPIGQQGSIPGAYPETPLSMADPGSAR